MKNTKRRLEFFAPYDYDGMTSHFQQMALDGWLIQGVRGNLWKYKKIQPQKLNFAVTHFENFTFNEAAPDNGQNEFMEMCAEYGWQLVAQYQTMMVFVTSDENAVPIETDPVVQLKNLHKSVKPILLGKNIAVLFNLIYNVGTRLTDIIKGKESLSFAYFATLMAMFVLLNIDTVDYIKWYKKATIMAEEQGEFYQQKTNKPIYVLQFVILWSILAVLLVFVAWLMWIIWEMMI